MSVQILVSGRHHTYTQVVISCKLECHSHLLLNDRKDDEGGVPPEKLVVANGGVAVFGRTMRSIVCIFLETSSVYFVLRENVQLFNLFTIGAKAIQWLIVT